jgi:hypothetical protein
VSSARQQRVYKASRWSPVTSPGNNIFPDTGRSGSRSGYLFDQAATVPRLRRRPGSAPPFRPGGMAHLAPSIANGMHSGIGGERILWFSEPGTSWPAVSPHLRASLETGPLYRCVSAMSSGCCGGPSAVLRRAAERQAAGAVAERTGHHRVELLRPPTARERRDPRLLLRRTWIAG